MRYGFPHLLISVALIGVTGGCAAPERAVMPAARDAAALASSTSLSLGEAAFPAERWWTAYGSAELDALIDEALRNAPDVAIAAARIRQADALAQQTGSAASPQLSAEGSIGGNKQSYNLGIPEQFVPKGILDTGRLAGSLSFDPDLWGRNRAALAAARGEALAAHVDAAQARLSLSSGIALLWGELALHRASRDVAAESARVMAETEALTAQRVRSGIGNQATLNLARARHASAMQTVAALDELMLLDRNRLAAIIGAGPDRAKSIALPPTDFAAPHGVPRMVAADLLGRRPDLVAARLRVDAAGQREQVARKDFLPNINLAAMVGLQSLGLGDLPQSDSAIANFGPAFSLPIFDGGRLKGRLAAAEAGRDEAVARYDQTLLSALHDVADALDSRRALAGRLEQARIADRASAEAARLVRMRYRAGITNLLEVLAAEDTALAARRTRAELEARDYLLDVMLVKALGGGFTSVPASTTLSDKSRTP